MGLSAHHRFDTSKIIDHQFPKYGRFTQLCSVWTFGSEFTAVHLNDLIPLSGRVNWSSVLNTPAGKHRSGLLWLLSGFYSAQHRMAKHRTSSWQTHQRPVPKPRSPQRRHAEGVSIVYLQFAVEIPSSSLWWIIELFDLDTVQRGCCVHCEAWGGGSLSSISRGRGRTRSSMAEILELSSLPLQLSLALRATSPPLCTQQHSCHRSQRSDLPPPPGTTHK